MYLIHYLAILLTFCILSFGYKLNDNYVEVHDIENNTISEQLPPQEPANHSFPTVPTVPLIPKCVKQGYFRDPFNCRKFYYCQHENAVPTGYYCQPGLIFNTVTDSCDDPTYVDC